MAKYNIVSIKIGKIVKGNHVGEEYCVATLMNADCPFSKKHPRIIMFEDTARIYVEAMNNANGNWQKAAETLPQAFREIHGVYEDYVPGKLFYLHQIGVNGEILDSYIKDFRGNPMVFNKLTPFVKYYYDTTQQKYLPIDGNDAEKEGSRLFSRLAEAIQEQPATDEIPDDIPDPVQEQPAQQPVQQQPAQQQPNQQYVRNVR